MDDFVAEFHEKMEKTAIIGSLLRAGAKAVRSLPGAAKQAYKPARRAATQAAGKGPAGAVAEGAKAGWKAMGSQGRLGAKIVGGGAALGGTYSVGKRRGMKKAAREQGFEDGYNEFVKKAAISKKEKELSRKGASKQIKGYLTGLGTGGIAGALVGRKLGAGKLAPGFLGAVGVGGPAGYGVGSVLRTKKEKAAQRKIEGAFGEDYEKLVKKYYEK